MNWKEKMKDWGGGEVSFLSEDGECITFCVIGDPVLIEGKFQGKDTQRIACPIVTVDGFTLLIVGKRIARRLSKYEQHFKNWAFDLIRHGEPADTKTQYELKRCDVKEKEDQILAIAKKAVPKEEIEEAVQAANEIAG